MIVAIPVIPALNTTRALPIALVVAMPFHCPLSLDFLLPLALHLVAFSFVTLLIMLTLISVTIVTITFMPVFMLVTISTVISFFIAIGKGRDSYDDSDTCE